MFRVTIALISLTLLGVLAACATLTEDQCRAANWYEVGYGDGQAGREASYFARHVEACSKHGIMPQQSPWQQGRDAGLRLFCVPESGYDAGRAGRAFPTVCLPRESIEMRPAYDWGRMYWRLTQEIEDLKNKIDKYEDQLKEITDPQDPLIEVLYARIFRAESEIRFLEHRRERYDRWPV